jgi:hypothetical protein
MGVTILDDSMSSDRSAHTARLAHGEEHRWEVSWLPGRQLDRNEAITAMVLADAGGSGDTHARHRLWGHLESWAAELGLTAPEALSQLTSPPCWENAKERSGMLADPEAGE